jgi:hypothetical protein
VTQVLASARIEYMLTGSYASSLHGTPRATQDFDLVIDPTGSQLTTLLSLLPDTDYYANAEAAFDALARRSQFNVVDLSTGWKIDFIVIKDRDFSRVEFQRRRLQELVGLSLFVASAEDVLLAKLEWAKLGSSARQMEDAAGIIRLQGAQLDTRYVERWVRVLEVEEQWTHAKALLPPPDRGSSP